MSKKERQSSFKQSEFQSFWLKKVTQRKNTPKEAEQDLGQWHFSLPSSVNGQNTTSPSRSSWLVWTRTAVFIEVKCGVKEQSSICEEYFGTHSIIIQQSSYSDEVESRPISHEAQIRGHYLLCKQTGLFLLDVSLLPFHIFQIRSLNVLIRNREVYERVVKMYKGIQLISPFMVP